MISASAEDPEREPVADAEAKMSTPGAIGYSFGKAVEAKECTPRQVRRGLMAGIEPLQMLFNVQAQSSSGGDR
jgi:hypothetical protein